MSFMSGIMLAGGILFIVGVVVVVLYLITTGKRDLPFDVTDDLGTCLVLKTKDVDTAYNSYLDLKKKQNGQGMIISRIYPERLLKKYSINDSTLLWLSYEKTDSSIDPSSLDKLEYLVYDFVSVNKRSIVLLDGMEYLILQNTFEETLKFLQSLSDHIILNGAILIIPLDPASLDEKQLSLIERELETFQVNHRLMRFFE
ncbi:MAG: DUF835 domain-containing protein [Theionarchaea archaeon]|nr:DUF835 domain-containing protein [Theionarchaea archaeon]